MKIVKAKRVSCKALQIANSKTSALQTDSRTVICIQHRVYEFYAPSGVLLCSCATASGLKIYRLSGACVIIACICSFAQLNTV